MKFKRNKGFTLIELLVVIAIIGILAAVVLTSLGSAREKARNASAQASMSQMRAEAELGTNTSGAYLVDLCNITGTTGGLGKLTTAVENQVDGLVACGQNTAVLVNPTAWGAAVDLDGAGGTFCVDSTGYAGASTAAAATEIAAGATSLDVVCDNL